MTASSTGGRTAKGDALLRRALEIIPGGSQTNAKRPPPGLEGAYPPYIARGEGAYVWDVDGNRYVDHKLGCGPVILGHGYPAVADAAAKQAREGLCFGSCHPSEVTLAELLIETIPCAEMVRLLKSGAEGSSAAVRVARTYTGRELLVSCGYHGWHDWSMAKHPAVSGVPACLKGLTVDLPFGDYQRLEDLFRERGDSIAALVFASPYQEEPETIGRFLRRARELTEKHGALLIYDEIVTGYRVAPGGLQELVGVVPDLAVFSKGMANGYPIAAVVGSRKAMGAWEKSIISSTFGGETGSIAAAIACISEHRDKRVTAAIAEQGAWFKHRIDAVGAEAGVAIKGMGFDALPMAVLQGEDTGLANAIHRALFYEGVMPYFPMWYISYSHDRRVMEETVAALRRALAQAKEQ